MLLFSKLNKICVGYFDPDFVLELVNTNNFQGELTDTLAKKEALFGSSHFVIKLEFNTFETLRFY